MTNSAQMSSRFSKPAAAQEARRNCTPATITTSSSTTATAAATTTTPPMAAVVERRKKLAEIGLPGQNQQQQQQRQHPSPRRSLTPSSSAAAANNVRRHQPSSTSVSSPMKVVANSPLLAQATKIRDRFISAVDAEYNVIDVVAVTDVIGQLEKFGVTKEILELTRLGKHVNEFRRKEAAKSSSALADRCKTLVKRWRQFLVPTAASSSSPSSTFSRVLSSNSNSCSPKAAFFRSEVASSSTSAVAKKRAISSPLASSQSLPISSTGALTPPKEGAEANHLAMTNGSLSKVVTTSPPKTLTPPSVEESASGGKQGVGSGRVAGQSGRRRNNHLANDQPSRSEMLERQLKVAVEAAQQIHMEVAKSPVVRSKIRTTEEIVRELTRKSDLAAAERAKVAAVQEAEAAEAAVNKIHPAAVVKRKRESIEVVDLEGVGSDGGSVLLQRPPPAARARLDVSDEQQVDLSRPKATTTTTSTSASAKNIDLNPPQIEPKSKKKRKSLLPPTVNVADYVELVLFSQLPSLDASNGCGGDSAAAADMARVQFDDLEEDDGFQMEGLLPPLRDATTAIPTVRSTSTADSADGGGQQKGWAGGQDGASLLLLPAMLDDDRCIDQINGITSAGGKFCQWHEVASVARRNCDEFLHILPYTIID